MVAPRSERKARPRQQDADLVKDCLAGKTGAWDELIDRYGSLVYTVARRSNLNDADAEDVFQGVFLQLHRSLDRLRECDRLAGWLLTTAQRESWRVSRRNRNQALVGMDGFMGQIPSDTEFELDRLDRQQLVQQALRQLGGRCEKLLVCLFSTPGDPNYAAIARELNMKLGSIGPTRARCFRKLELILLELGFEPESSADDAHGDVERTAMSDHS